MAYIKNIFKKRKGRKKRYFLQFALTLSYPVIIVDKKALRTIRKSFGLEYPCFSPVFWFWFFVLQLKFQ